MKNALILHGTSGSSQGNWYQWLKSQLEDRGYQVYIPDLPGAEQPNLQRYNEFLLPKFDFNGDSLLIGHSSGAVAVLGLLQVLPLNIKVAKAILVAGFKDDLNWPELKDFFSIEFNWEKIKSQTKEIVLIHSDNDPYVPLEHGNFLAEKLNTKLVIFHGQKHFNIGTMGEKYRQFPELLRYI